jgi:hypothetical protein
MPATSELADRLANDLVRVGETLGFKAVKEEPVVEKSTYRIDVLWSMPMPTGSPFPVVNIASIEIQYSDSPTSISHNIFKAEKTVHPSFHVVISYNKLSDDYKTILKSHYPISGLVVLEGDDEVRKLNLWITRFIAVKAEETKLAETGGKILRFALHPARRANQLQTIDEIRKVFRPDIQNLFLPPEVESLLRFLVETKSLASDRALLDDVFNAFIGFIQNALKSYKVAYVQIPARYLFSEFNIEEEFKTLNIELSDTIEIRQDSVVIRDMNGYPLEIHVQDGNARIESPPGTVCIEPLKASDIIYFVTAASQNIKDQLSGYELSDEDKNKLIAIENASTRAFST